MGKSPWFERLIRACRGLVVYWWQRRTRGFDDSELWSLDYTIMRFAIPRLHALERMVHGYPGEFLYGEGATSESIFAFDSLPREVRKRREAHADAEWRATILKMARSFELWLEHDGMFGEAKPGVGWVEDTQMKKEFDEGWALFHKYFFALWD